MLTVSSHWSMRDIARPRTRVRHRGPATAASELILMTRLINFFSTIIYVCSGAYSVVVKVITRVICHALAFKSIMGTIPGNSKNIA